jgi:hypothetical protein
LFITSIAVLVVLGLIVGATFLPSQSAQILAGILGTVIATLVSVFASYHFSAAAAGRGAKDELTRYGLLAWRNLDSLQLKLDQQLQQPAPVTPDTLRSWSLDVDQAKWAWRDLLRDVFALQERLQAETVELARKFREEMQKAAPAERPRLEAEHQLQLARLQSSSPLPLRIPGEVPCPNCGGLVSVLVGRNTGDTHTLRCPSCKRMFHAHRNADGSLFVRRSGHHFGATPATPAPAASGAAKPGAGAYPLFVAPRERLACLEVVGSVFASAPDEVLKDGWVEFFGKVGSRLETAGLSPTLANGVKTWLYTLRVFRLLGIGNGIGLVVPARDLVAFAEERTAQLLWATQKPASPAAAAEEMYGDAATRTAELGGLLERLVPQVSADTALPERKEPQAL